MKITRAVVPSLFTVLNIFCGFRSIIYSSQGDFGWAAWFIVLAGVFDTFDGIMARITRSSSDFGVEFDSLSDVVSFGAAPSFMVYALHLPHAEGIWMLISSMPMIFGALRLARFNTQLVGYDKDFFRGLPIPASAVTIASFVLTYAGVDGSLNGLESALLAPMIIVLSLLMVSTIKYDTIPKFSRRGFVAHPLRFTVTVIGMTAIVLTGGDAIFPFFVFYVATGPLRYMIRSIRHSLHPVEKTDDENNAEVTSVDV
jgi:CDP-diacylglycerol---serine O-phosphatidyltransferase